MTMHMTGFGKKKHRADLRKGLGLPPNANGKSIKRALKAGNNAMRMELFYKACRKLDIPVIVAEPVSKSFERKRRDRMLATNPQLRAELARLTLL